MNCDLVPLYHIPLAVTVTSRLQFCNSVIDYRELAEERGYSVVRFYKIGEFLFQLAEFLLKAGDKCDTMNDVFQEAGGLLVHGGHTGRSAKMPCKSNDIIAEIMVEEGFFQSQTTAGLRSDNWRIVEDSRGRKAILYIVRFLSKSKRGEPKRIPNEPNALRRLSELHGTCSSREVGPFIALAKESAMGIVHIRVWHIPPQDLSAQTRLEVVQLGNPVCEYIRV